MRILKNCALILLLLIGCKDKANLVDQEQMEPSDSDVEALFKSSQGQVLDKDSVPKYIKMVPQADATQEIQIEHLSSDFAEGCDLPSAINQLHGGVDFKIYKFDQNMSVAANAMGFDGNIGRKQMVFIQDFVRYDYITCNGQRTKVGIGLRCLIHVKSFKGKLGYSNLPAIAASVELGRAQASFELKTLGFGIDGSILADGLPPEGEYTVENFGKLAVVFSNVLKTLNASNNLEIRPVEFP